MRSRFYLVVLVCGAVRFAGGNFTCIKNGLYADYERGCNQYYRCNNGRVSTFKCPLGRAFSEAESRCVPGGPCVPRQCSSADNGAYAEPGSACRHYYWCEKGQSLARSCPPGSWFDTQRNACTLGAGVCYEPLCVGLVDGIYPDPSHDCRRAMVCKGSRVVQLVSCDGGLCAGVCPPARHSSMPIPAGDADFCDASCSSLCESSPDGPHADRTTGCREYFVCEKNRVISRGACEEGFLFNGLICTPSEEVKCKRPTPGICTSRSDGPHREWRDCTSWFQCSRGRLVGRGECGNFRVFDGRNCVSRANFHCEAPIKSRDCEGLPSGIYQDLDSNCTKYYHCESGMKMMFKCPTGLVYDGTACVSIQSYVCPSLESGSCYGRTDGRYKSADSGCRGYHMCAAGNKAMYACTPGEVFVDDKCVTANDDVCKSDDLTCRNLANGYHAELQSNCKRYFYCEGGDRLATLSCLGGKIFDGRSCVDPTQHICGTSPRSMHSEHCETDGFFPRKNTNCRGYYVCTNGEKTELWCPDSQLFNGFICVPHSLYTCPG